MKTFKEFQESYLKTAVKIAAPFVGLGLLGQLGKKNPLQNQRDKVQTKKQKKSAPKIPPRARHPDRGLEKFKKSHFQLQKSPSAHDTRRPEHNKCKNLYFLS